MHVYHKVVSLQQFISFGKVFLYNRAFVIQHIAAGALGQKLCGSYDSVAVLFVHIEYFYVVLLGLLCHAQCRQNQHQAHYGGNG